MIFSKIYASLFARKQYYQFNKYIYNLSLKGMGIGNYYNQKLSGEDFVIKNFLNGNDMVVFDIGANEGNWSLDLLKINPNVFIYSFEPSPINYSILSFRLKDFNNVKVFNCGIGETNNTLPLYDYGDSDGSEHASLQKEVLTREHYSKTISEHLVDIKTIDSFVKENYIQSIDFIKIDTEGYEMPCLLGAKNSIERGIIKIIQFEFNTMNVYTKVFFKDFYDLLSGQYNLYRLLPNGLIQIEKYEVLTCEIFGFQNILAIKK